MRTSGPFRISVSLLPLGRPALGPCFRADLTKLSTLPFLPNFRKQIFFYYFFNFFNPCVLAARRITILVTCKPGTLDFAPLNSRGLLWSV